MKMNCAAERIYIFLREMGREENSRRDRLNRNSPSPFKHLPLSLFAIALLLSYLFRLMAREEKREREKKRRKKERKKEGGNEMIFMILDTIWK